MKNNFLTGVIFLAANLFTSGSLSAVSLQSYAEHAVSPNPEISAPAIAFLRAQGPAGLQALLDANEPLLAQHKSGVILSSPVEQIIWQRLEGAMDAVSAQRDCEASHLYWYTNFDEAKAAAKAAGKPILSLRLLGKLNEEYSCANSRFFRTTLYANEEVSAYLRGHFILHWQSVRPVPRITIDFGDGRKIERTITGNSIHYILDSEGRTIDALPGLYGPKAFLKGLDEAEQAALASAKLSSPAFDDYLRKFHSERYAATIQAWNTDLAAIGPGATADLFFVKADASAPSVPKAARLAVSKGRVETPMLDSFQRADDATWARIAQLHYADARLDASSAKLIRAKYPTAKEAAPRAITKTYVESPLVSAMRNLQRSISEDTVRNEYQLHSQIHEWFMNGAAPKDLGQFNSLVYAKLFLTPDSDPWLGLVPADTITALDNNGLVQASGNTGLR